MLSFGEVKDSSAINIAGVAVTSSQFKQWLNDAVRRLLTRGDFPGTLVPIFVCAQNGCVTWPRYVGQIRKLYTCNRDIGVKGIWYQFLDRQCWRGMCGSEISVPGTFPGGGYAQPAVNQGRYPIHKDIMGDGRYVRLYPRCQQDVGKAVTIFGVDNGNQPLKHRNDSGDWEDGIRMILQLPYVQTTTFVRRIERVVKEVTQCQVLAYGVDSTTSDTLEDLAIWDGSEISPSRLRQRVFVGCGCDGTSSGVTALVKLAFVPVRTDEDWVLIDNLDALKLMIQCIKREEAGDRIGAREYEADAIRELNLQSLNEMPDNELPVDVEPTSGVCVNSYGVF